MERVATCLGRQFSNVLKFGTLGLCFLCGLGMLKFGHGDRLEIPFCPSSPQDGIPNPAVASRSTVLVSTLDGAITALDMASGLVLWRHKTEPGPLLSSTISNYEFVGEGKSEQMIPTLDGDLYSFVNGEMKDGMAISAKRLLSNTIKISDDLVFSGGKEKRTYGIHRKTGQVLYTCGMDACKYSGIAVNDDEVLVIRRVYRTVRASSSLTGIEKWNYSVGQIEADIASPYTMQGGCHSSGAEGYDGAKILAKVKFATKEGYMFVTNTVDGNEGHWDHKFESPIARAWRIDGVEVNELDMFKNNYHDAFLVNESDTGDSKLLAYVGYYNNQPYIMQSRNVMRTMALEWNTGNWDLTSAAPMVTWQPYLSTSVSRTPVIRSKPPDGTTVVIRTKGNGENTALAPATGDYPFDSGFYVIKTLPMNSTPKHFVIADVKGISGEDDSIIVSMWHWWKEILATSLTFAVLINVLFVRLHINRIRAERTSEPGSQLNCQTLPLSSELQSQIPLTSLLLQSQTEISSSSGMTSMATPPTTFVSRYYSEYESVKILGKGGFGVVFKARQKVDEGEFAIKRISLSQGNDFKDRILREVKVLVRLDHQNIVRYCNSWLEYPPEDWQPPVDDPNYAGNVWTPSLTYTTDDLHNSFARTSPSMDAAAGDTEDIRFTKGSSSNSVRAMNWRKDRSRLHSPFFNNPTGDSLDSLKSRESRGDVSEDSFIQFARRPGDDSHSISCDDSKLRESSSEGSRIHDSFIQFKRQKGDDSHSIFSDDAKRCESSSKDLSIQFKEGTESNAAVPLAASSSSRPPFKSYLYIQMQLCREDNLRDWLRCHTDDRHLMDVLTYFHQIVSAVEYVHDHGHMHRDLKPSNIFFSMEGVIKIGDFGLVANVPVCHDMNSNNSYDSSSVFVSQNNTNQVGTRLYMSPEQLAEEPYDHKVDIFSLGLILFEMLVPFNTEMERFKVMSEARERRFPDSFVAEFPDEHELVKKMLSHNAKDRPSATEIKESALLQDFLPRDTLIRKVRSRSMSMNYSTSSSSSSGNSGSGAQASP